MFADFKECLLCNADFIQFKAKYAQNVHSKCTLETAANTVFSLCTVSTPCVHVNKHHYVDLNTCRINKEQSKAFYNGLCNTCIGNDNKLIQYGKQTYCMQKQQMCCKLHSVYTSAAKNLGLLYYQSCLSDPFLCVDANGLHKTQQTLYTLLK